MNAKVNRVGMTELGRAVLVSDECRSTFVLRSDGVIIRRGQFRDDDGKWKKSSTRQVAGKIKTTTLARSFEFFVAERARSLGARVESFRCQ